MWLAPQRQRSIATQKPDLITCQQLNFFDKANCHRHRCPAAPAKNITSNRRMKIWQPA
jgi:hypothetical protein